MASKIASQGYSIYEASSSGLFASSEVSRNMSHNSTPCMDVDSLLHQLNDPSSNQRAAALEQLSDLVLHSSNGDLPAHDHVSLFQSLALALRDPDWEIKNKALNVLSEVTTRDGMDIDSCMTVVLPHLVPCLGDIKVTVRRSAIQCIHTYMKHTSDFLNVIDAVVRFGLEAEETSLQRDTCVSVPLLLTPDFAQHDFFGFIQALTKKLLAREEVVVNAGLKALESIRGIIGEAKFTNHVNRLSPALQRYYFRMTGREPRSGESSSISKPVSKPTKSIAPELSSNSLSVIETLPVGDNRSPELSRKMPLNNYVDRRNLAFGIVPTYIMDQLEDSDDFRMRAQAVDELKTTVSEIDDVNQIIPHLGHFLEFLLCLLDDTNFKITTVTLEILIMLVDRLGVIIQPHFRQIVVALSKRLGDNKIVVRQAVMRLAILLMQNLKPHTVLSLICENLRNRNSRVRQETLNITICALLTFPSTDFDQALICRWVAPCLTDAKRAVRHAALECMAVLAQSMGAGNLHPIVDAVEESAGHQDGNELLKAVQARLARRQLPRYTVDGLIEYSSPVPTSATHRRSAAPVGADSELVLAASSSAGSARARPAELVDLESPLPVSAETTPSTTERRRVSAGKVSKAKLPWEQEDSTSAYSTPARSRAESPTQNGSLSQVPHPARTQRKLEPLNTTSVANGVSSAAVASALTSSFLSQQQQQQQSPQSPSESSTQGGGDPVCPIPTRPALVRSAGKRRGAAPVVPPIPLSSQASLADREEPDSGIQSAAPSATRRGSVPFTGRGDVSSAYTTPPGSDNEEGEMDGSLTTIRSSASRKKAQRVFEEAERRASQGSAGLRHAKSDSRLASRGSPPPTATKEAPLRAKYSPYGGATFKENPTYDGKIIGRRVGDDAAAPADGPGLAAPRPKERRRQAAKGVFEVGRQDEDRGNAGASKGNGRRGSKSEAPGSNPPSGIVGIGLEKTSSLSEDDDINSQDNLSKPTMSKTFQESLAQKKRLQQMEAEQRRLALSASRESFTLPSPLDSHRDPLEEAPPSEREKVRRQNATTGSVGFEMGAVNGGRGAVGAPAANASSKPPAGNGTPKRPKPRNSDLGFKSPNSVTSMSSGFGDSASVSSEDPETAGPFNNADKVFPEALQLIAANDWQSKCQGLGLVRRLAYHHKEVLLRDLHPCVLGVTQELKNLRSQVARTAIQTLGDMYLCLGRAMDADLDLTVRMLLHKSGDSSTFIRDDVEAALGRMVDAVTPQRAVTALIQGGCNHRNMQVRRFCARNLCLVCERMGPGRVLSGVKEVTDRILPVAAQFTMDGSPETRWFGRRIFHGLLQHQDFNRMCQRFVPANTWRNMQDIITNLRTKGLGECPSAAPSAGMRRSESLTRGSSAGSLAAEPSPAPGRGSTSAPHPPAARRSEAGAEEARRVAAQLGAANWATRHAAVAELAAWCEALEPGAEPAPGPGAEAVRQHSTRLLDAFVPRLGDSNSKVNLFALQALEQMLPGLRELALGPVASVLVQHTAANLASRNQEIARTAARLLDALPDQLDPAMLVQAYVQAVAAANSRVKPEMIGKLAALTDRLCPRKPRLVTLHVLPELWRLLAGLTGAGAGAGAAGGCRAAVQGLVAVLHEHLRDDLMELARSHASATPRTLQLLSDLVDNAGRGS